MKLKNGRFNYTNSHKEYIGYNQLRRCLFRFLKEFGYYSAYINGIKPYMVEYYVGDLPFPEEKELTFKEFIRRNYKALSRMMFPGGELWDDIYSLWTEWAFEEDKIYSRTRLL